jgi:hypothetical protein
VARTFRYFHKKRGHRRTVTRAGGRLGEAVFFASLLVVGIVGLFAGIRWLVIPEWRVNHGFLRTECTVISKQVHEVQREKGYSYAPQVHVEYQVGNDTHRSWAYDIHQTSMSTADEAQAALARFEDGRHYPCWYDPADPNYAVLVRGYQWWIWLVFLIPASFLAIGIGGLTYALLHWGKSAERRAATTRTGPAQELLELPSEFDPEFPQVPDGSEITSSPGTRLAYRLPLSGSPGWMLFGLLAAALAWNGALSYFIYVAVRRTIAGNPDWMLIVFIMPFLAVGAILAIIFVRQLLYTTGIGPTLLEITEHPLIPGESYRLFVSQSGNLTMQSIAMTLVCEEEAVFRQGTNARTETRQVYESTVLEKEGLIVKPGEPFEEETNLEIPASAMHSFRSLHNELRWKIVVQGVVVGRYTFRRTFPVVVRPAVPKSAMALCKQRSAKP